MAEIENIHCPICTKPIPSSWQNGLSPALAKLEQRAGQRVFECRYLINIHSCHKYCPYIFWKQVHVGCTLYIHHIVNKELHNELKRSVQKRREPPDVVSAETNGLPGGNKMIILGKCSLEYFIQKFLQC